MYGGLDIENKQIKEILVKGNYVQQVVFDEALKKAKPAKISVLDQLASQGVVTKDLLGQAMAEYYKVSYADLNSNRPIRDKVLTVPEDIAKKFRLAYFTEDKKKIVLTTDNPAAKGLLAAAKKLYPKRKIVIQYSIPEDINNTFVNYQKALDTRFSKIIAENKKVAPEIVDEIFKDAITYRASDIHFEPQEADVVVRFRVDGVLHEAGRLPKENYENVLNRIKVKAQLRIDEHFTPQDGALRYELENNKIDLRVSIVPTVVGEKITIRILSSYIRGFSLTDLGLGENEYNMLAAEVKKPFGMIVVTGPTGSGKTTTLYSLLKMINTPAVNITTIEDPVEYKIQGVNQIQVNEMRDLTFSRGLRSIVRQDPDVILVGEVRDKETVEISVNAALTGHLLLTTFHANDAATTIPRLLDMGAEPFLLASTLEVIVAQRLVRKICESCRYSKLTPVKDINKILPNAKKYFKGTKVNLYKGKGCESCGDTGYSGRIAIFEVIRVTPEMEELIMTNPSSNLISQLAYKQGTKPLFEDGIDKIKQGLTTIEELQRVAPNSK